MATQVRDKSAKHDAFISSQLDRVSQRIRLIDVSTALGGWLAGSLAYLIVMVIFDRFFVLAGPTRQSFFTLYAIASLVYLYLTVLRPLRWRVNPYYAARQLEHTLAGNRNHVINWIDLQAEKVPGVIRSALGQRAAKDLTQVDMDRAISTRRAYLVATIACVQLVTLLLLFFLIGPGPFRSLVGRALAPFGRTTGIATRTQVEVVRPDGGHALVTIGSPVTIVAEVTGRRVEAHAKDAPCLLYRHDETEPYRRRYLQQDAGDLWGTTVSPIDVGNGFTYKIVAGDGESPEYRVAVRATPLISDFLATYHFRPYVGRAPRSRITRKLEELRGTEVHLLARTNRIIKEGRLDFEAAEGAGSLLRPELLPEDPQALRFKFVLDRPGKYRIRFTSTEGESYVDPVAHDVIILPDHPPQVTLTQPGKDVTAPANGHLELAGEALDDIGIASLRLRMQVVGGPMLADRPFLPEKLGKGEFGTPKRVEYKEVLEFDRLRDEQNHPFTAKAGVVLEYWLEASDACDAPQPNVGSSQRYKITLTDPTNDPNQQKNRESAKQRQGQHEKQQSEQMKNEKSKREEQREREAQQEQEDARQREEKRSNAGNDEGKPADQQPDNGEQKGKNEQDDKQGGERGGAGKEDAARGDKEQNHDDRTKEQADELKRALEKRQQEQENRGKSEQQSEKASGDKGNQSEKEKGEARGDGERKPGESKNEGDKPSSESKSAPKPGEGKESGQQSDRAGSGKESGEKKGEQSQGEGKDGGKPDPKEGAGAGKPSEKSGQPGQPKPAEAKPGDGGKGEENNARKPEKQDPGKGKDGGRPEQSGQAGEGKPAGENTRPNDPNSPGQGKEAKNPNPPNNPDRSGETKEGMKPTTEKKGERKPGETSDRRPLEGDRSPAQSKLGEKEQSSKESKPGTCKNCPNGGKAAADGSKPGENKAEGTGRGNSQGDPKEASRQDVENLKRGTKEGNRQQRESNKQALQEIRDQAKDPEAREAAGKALDDLKQQQPGQAKPDEGKGTARSGESKPGEGQGQAEAEAKPGNAEGMGDSGEGKSSAKPGADNKGPKTAPGQAKSEDNGTANQPGEGLSGDRRGGSGSSNGESQPIRKDRAARHRPSSMQLEEFRKKVDRDVLKDAKMSPEEFKRFLDEYSKLVQRQSASGQEVEPPTIPGRSGPLPSMGGSSIKRTAQPGATDVRNEGRPNPPPEYRDAHRDFLNRLLTPTK